MSVVVGGAVDSPAVVRQSDLLDWTTAPVHHGVWMNNGRSMGPETASEGAVVADRAGWDGVFLGESFSGAGSADLWTLLAGIATRASA